MTREGIQPPEDELFATRIQGLKDPERYKAFGTAEVAALQQAIDILVELRNHAALRRQLAFEKLNNAIRYLNEALKTYVDTSEKTS